MSGMSSSNKNNNFITTTMTFKTNLQDNEHQNNNNNNNQQHHYHHYQQQQQYEQKQQQQQQSRQKIMALNDYYFFETNTTTNTHTTMNANECNLHPLRIFPTTSSNPNNTCTTYHTTTAKPSPIIVYQTNLNNNNDCHNHNNNHNSHHHQHNHHNHLAYTNDESFALRSALKQHFLQKQKQKNLSNNKRINNEYTTQENFQTNLNWNENNDNIEEIHQESQTTKMYNFSFHPVSTTTTTTTNIDASNNTNSVGKTFTDTNNIYQSRNTFRGNLNQVLTDALDLICDTDDGVENNNNNNNNVSLDNDDNDDNISMISEMTISTEHDNCMMEPNHAVIVPAEKYKIKIPVVSTSNLTTMVDASTANSQDISVLTNNKEDGDDQDDDFTVNTALFDDDLPTIAYNNNVDHPLCTANSTEELNNNKPTVVVASPKSSSASCTTGIINMKQLKVYMERSRITQEMLQDWDEKNGLPRSHSVTMFRTNRSRTQLLENRILPKWNGKPLIGNEPIIQKKKIHKKNKKNCNNKIKQKKHSLQQCTMRKLKKQTNK